MIYHMSYHISRGRPNDLQEHEALAICLQLVEAALTMQFYRSHPSGLTQRSEE
jgi:hypothetical protein